MMRFLLLKAFGSSNEGGRLFERHHDATVVKTSARDEAQPAFVTRNVFGNEDTFFFNWGLAVSIAARRLYKPPHIFPRLSGRLAALSWTRNGRGLQKEKDMNEAILTAGEVKNLLDNLNFASDNGWIVGCNWDRMSQEVKDDMIRNFQEIITDDEVDWMVQSHGTGWGGNSGIRSWNDLFSIPLEKRETFPWEAWGVHDLRRDAGVVDKVVIEWIIPRMGIKKQWKERFLEGWKKEKSRRGWT